MRKLVCMLLVAFLLVGCSKDEKKVQDNEPKENNVEEKTDPPKATEEFENIYPLTGMGTNNAVDNKIVSVMVNNHPSARPQSGLSKADIVFEILAEGQITRLLAFYQSEMPVVVGPVRSSREYYFELANMYQALYVYHGAANFINDMIKNRGIEHLDGAIYDNDGNLFKRESFRKAPHNSYLQFGAAYDVAEGKGYETTAEYEPLAFLAADELSDLSGDPAEQAEIAYSKNAIYNVEYKYDDSTEKYTRFSNQEETVELDTGDLIELDNIFIIETSHQVIDDAGRRAIDLLSGGDAYLIQKGIVQEVQWETRDGRVIPVRDGKPIGLVPGKTWINVIPANPGLQQTVTITN
ncbi:DUF3048 domain-containing protein [Virgibacillus sp. C22-A2]|uniref:DUF3048 domain-containing protein n=1 Tax=Virgibacillus tibetensis TaxID=3042313 RepID=A0ABU6KGA5_9BACI|nr:DUF3048 domain-containing protein [Virgibacillus sp. C22-A2]